MCTNKNKLFINIERSSIMEAIDFAYENEKTRAIAIKNKSKWVGPLKKTGLYLLLIAMPQ